MISGGRGGEKGASRAAAVPAAARAARNCRQGRPAASQLSRTAHAVAISGASRSRTVRRRAWPDWLRQGLVANGSLTGRCSPLLRCPNSARAFSSGAPSQRFRDRSRIRGSQMQEEYWRVVSVRHRPRRVLRGGSPLLARAHCDQGGMNGMMARSFEMAASGLCATLSAGFEPITSKSTIH